MQVVENPSFETGWSPWELTHGVVFRVTCPADGLYGLGFGGSNNEAERVIQEVTVPEWAETGAAYFSWMMVSEDSTMLPYDWFSLQVWDVSQEPPTNLLLSAVYNNDPRAAWYVRRVALTGVPALRGHSLQVALLATTDGLYPTWWCIDNVRLVFACGSQVP